MRRLAPTLLCCVFLFALSAVPAQSAGCRNADAVPGSVTPKRHAQAVRCLVGAQRARFGLARLRPNARLAVAAKSQVRDMVRRRFFGHLSSDGTGLGDRVRRAGYTRSTSSWLAGETLAWGVGGLGTPRALVRSWMASPGHRGALLSADFKELGVAVVLRSPQGQRRRAVTAAAVLGRRTFRH